MAAQAQVRLNTIKEQVGSSFQGNLLIDSNNLQSSNEQHHRVHSVQIEKRSTIYQTIIPSDKVPFIQRIHHENINTVPIIGEKVQFVLNPRGNTILIKMDQMKILNQDSYNKQTENEMNNQNEDNGNKPVENKMNNQNVSRTRKRPRNQNDIEHNIVSGVKRRKLDIYSLIYEQEKVFNGDQLTPTTLERKGSLIGRLLNANYYVNEEKKLESLSMFWLMYPGHKIYSVTLWNDIARLFSKKDLEIGSIYRMNTVGSYISYKPNFICKTSPIINTEFQLKFYHTTTIKIVSDPNIALMPKYVSLNNDEEWVSPKEAETLWLQYPQKHNALFNVVAIIGSLSGPTIFDTYKCIGNKNEVNLVFPGGQCKITLWGREAFIPFKTGSILLLRGVILQNKKNKLEMRTSYQGGYISVLNSINDCLDNAVKHKYVQLQNYFKKFIISSEDMTLDRNNNNNNNNNSELPEINLSVLETEQFFKAKMNDINLVILSFERLFRYFFILGQGKKVSVNRVNGKWVVPSHKNVSKEIANKDVLINYTVDVMIQEEGHDQVQKAARINNSAGEQLFGISAKELRTKQMYDFLEFKQLIHEIQQKTYDIIIKKYGYEIISISLCEK